MSRSEGPQPSWATAHLFRLTPGLGRSERRRGCLEHGGRHPRAGRAGAGALTVKLGLPGWMRSSASTQMPLVSFRDW